MARGFTDFSTGEQVDFTETTVEPNESRSVPKESTKGKRKDNSKRNLTLFLRVLFYALVFVGTWFAWLNLQPYVLATKWMMESVVNPDWLIAGERLLGFDSLVSLVFGFTYLVIGALIWAAIQLIECFPLVLKNNAAFMRSVISNSEKHQKYEVTEGEDPTTMWLKNLYNSLPVQFIKTIKRSSLVAYVIDFLICFTVYPPVDGGFTKFVFYMVTMQFSKFNYANLALMFVTLFAVEAILKVLIVTGKFVWHVQTAK